MRSGGTLLLATQASGLHTEVKSTNPSPQHCKQQHANILNIPPQPPEFHPPHLKSYRAAAETAEGRHCLSFEIRAEGSEGGRVYRSLRRRWPWVWVLWEGVANSHRRKGTGARNDCKEREDRSDGDFHCSRVIRGGCC